VLQRPPASSGMKVHVLRSYLEVPRPCVRLAGPFVYIKGAQGTKTLKAECVFIWYERTSMSRTPTRL